MKLKEKKSKIAKYRTLLGDKKNVNATITNPKLFPNEKS